MRQSKVLSYVGLSTAFALILGVSVFARDGRTPSGVMGHPPVIAIAEMPAQDAGQNTAR